VEVEQEGGSLKQVVEEKKDENENTGDHVKVT
jgi:hypothetical protein